MTTTSVTTRPTPQSKRPPVDAAPVPGTQHPAGTVRVEKGEIALCFPLVARPRPACPPLRARVDRAAIAARAAVTATEQHIAVQEAGKALTVAALIARDSQQPDLAKRITARHIGLYTGQTRPLTFLEARQVVGAATSLARAELYAGQSPDQGVTMLVRILEATYRRATITLDALPQSDLTMQPLALPLGDVDSTRDEHRLLVALAQTQLLVGGTSALARVGRWAEAAELAGTYGGSGTRLLEGRQALIISRLLTRDGNGARALVAESDVSSDTDHDVATCLAALCAPSAMKYDAATAMVDRYRTSAAPVEGYAYSRARYGSAVAVIARTHRHPAAAGVAAQTAREALESGDGYAAQEVLRHLVTTESISDRDRAGLEQIVDAAGLTGKGLSGRLLKTLEDAVDLAVHAVRPDQ